MSSVSLTQAAFNSGELSPSLYARTNIDRYQSAAKIIKNFAVRTHGGLDKRGGSYFVGEVQRNDVPSRLIRFQFSPTQGYALEFGHKVMRVISQGGLVVKNDGAVYELPTPYDIDEVWQMKYEQSADVIFITHPSHPQRMLKRLGHNDWKFEDITFNPKIAAPTGLTLTAFKDGDKTYKYRVTAISDASGEESLPVEASVKSKTMGITEDGETVANYITIKWNAVAGCKSYNVYRYGSGMYGWISTVVNATTMDDENIKQDFTVTPPTSRNPFNGDNNKPSAVSIHEQRAVYGATYSDSELIEMSKVANYNNFTMANPLQDDDAISIRAAGKSVNTIYYFIPLEDLLVSTANGIWKVTPTDTNYLTPKCKIKQLNVYKCDNIQPIIVGNTALIMVDGRVRTLGYTLEADGYDGTEISIFATHLFEGRELVCWDYCSKTSQVWFVFADGEMATLTFVKEHQLYAFTRYETNGWFESIASVKEGNDETVYATVMRTVNGEPKRYIEQFLLDQQYDDKNDDFLFLDCAARLDMDVEVQNISGLDWLEGCKVMAWADGGCQGPFTVEDGKIELESAAKSIKVGLAYESLLRTLNIDYPVSQLTTSSQGFYKRIPSVNIYVQNSAMFDAAVVDDENGDALNFAEPKLDYMTYGEGYELSSGYKRIDLPGGYTKNGEIVIRSDTPTPLTINAIIPEVVHGG